MFRWLFVMLLALVLLNGFMPWLRKLGLGKLPGDFSFTLLGRLWSIPLGSSIVLSLLASLISKWI
jgi:hypothetical protein